MTPDELIKHPAYQALLKHATGCARCATGARCPTGGVLLKTLDALREEGVTAGR